MSATPAAPPAITTQRYRLQLSADGRWAQLSAPDGTPWVRLSLLAAFDTLGAPDETLAVEAPVVARAPDGNGNPSTTVTVRRRSSVFAEAVCHLECRDDALVLRHEVEGRGRLDEVRLAGGRSLAVEGLGVIYSGSELPTLFSPNPEDPRHLLRSAGKPAVVGVLGDSLPGRGHWFFTPAPLFFALAAESGLAAPEDATERGWLGLGLVAPITALTCTEFGYVPADEGFFIRLAYEGHQEVAGRFAAPALVLLPGCADPYTGLADYRAQLVAADAVPPPSERAQPAWWRAPMFCGWGAQCRLAALDGRPAKEHCSESTYEEFLAELAARDIVPATVVVDDGWQGHYGLAVPHPQRWPDLRGFIDRRHDAGQKVLLWWKAWDPEGVPPEWCVTDPAGMPVAIDPTHPQAAAHLAATIRQFCAPDGFDADGMKVDFTARTPSGYALRGAGDAWGMALLHELLRVVYVAAKEAKPDALVITHTPNAAFADVSDMIRLNDMLRLDEQNPDSPLVSQMRYRARVVAATCPELLIDTDDWCAPSLAQWREYWAMKDTLGVPALYYTTHLDRTGEELAESDFALVRAVFATARAAASAGGPTKEETR